MDITAYLQRKKDLVDQFLDKAVPPKDAYPPRLHEAIRYSLFAGGKRIRPIVAMAAFGAAGGRSRAILPIAAALELIHTYSLIHDDLPSMDNDDFRRGRPTSHKVFGDAMAILTGDALLTLAFHLMTDERFLAGVPPQRLVRVVHEVSTGAGDMGMVGGQALDIEAEGRKIDSTVLESIHTRKTGALIRASVRAGAILGGATAGQLTALTSYGEKIGLAFQIADDILDVEGTREEMGKDVKSDASKGKPTYPALLGLEAAKRKAAAVAHEAIASVKGMGRRADPLRALALYIVERRR